MKINKMPEFYTTFVRKMPNFTLCLPEKIFSGIFWGVMGEGNPLTPVSYAYGWAPGPHQLNPALATIECATVQFYSTLFKCKIVYLQYLSIRHVKFCFIYLHKLIYNIKACVKIVCPLSAPCHALVHATAQ